MSRCFFDPLFTIPRFPRSRGDEPPLVQLYWVWYGFPRSRGDEPGMRFRSTVF